MVKYPADWKECKIGDFLRIQRGASPRPIEDYLTLATQSVNWIKIGDAPKAGKYIVSTEERITWEGARHSVYVKQGEFILSNSMSFGRPYILKTNGCIHDGWLRLYDFQNEVHSNFLYYILSSRAVKEQYAAFAAGSGVQNLNKKIVKDVEVILPPLEEQKAIADALTAFDTYIDDLTALIQKKKDIRDGALEDLVSGRTRLAVYSDWKEINLREIFYINAGGDLQKEYFSSHVTQACPYKVFSNAIDNRGLYGYTSKAIYPGDSITVTARGTIGKAFYRKEPFDAIIRLLVLIPKSNDICAKFYSYYINHFVKFNYESTGVPQLTIPKIGEIKVPFFDIAEQQAIADTLTAMDEEIQQLEAKRDKMKDIRDGAMDDLLTGRIRLN